MLCVAAHCQHIHPRALVGLISVDVAVQHLSLSLCVGLAEERKYRPPKFAQGIKETILMEDVNKEMEHRRRIMGIYKKTRNDFDSKEDFDMYLEAVEDIIYKLASNIDVADVEQQVQDYIRQEAALAGVAAGPADGAPAYMPQAVAMQVLQPAPLQPVQQDAEGRLLPVQPGATMDRQKWQLMAQASGWTQELATQRMLHDAFTTIFVF
ncbi:hypothetical protein COO60DRAFT_785980 [Scenedesmus sp. NREL 46B-D3]|nr:hypothetical protein COO60DRAFT_785980 [Scenedesmus sp. NREL 46B-D3]